MLTIRKLTEKEINAVKRSDADSRFYGVVEDENVAEYAEYVISEDALEILNITERADNLALIDGLMRTILFTTDPTSVKYIALPDSFPLTAKLFGFTKTDNGYVLKLEDFTNHCKG